MSVIISHKKTQDETRKEIKFLDDRPMRFEKFVCAGNEESWVCSRKSFDQEAGRECRGRARCKTGGGILKTYIPHDDWCKPKPHDEEFQLTMDETKKGVQDTLRARLSRSLYTRLEKEVPMKERELASSQEQAADIEGAGSPQNLPTGPINSAASNSDQQHSMGLSRNASASNAAMAVLQTPREGGPRTTEGTPTTPITTTTHGGEGLKLLGQRVLPGVGKVDEELLTFPGGHLHVKTSSEVSTRKFREEIERSLPVHGYSTCNAVAALRLFERRGIVNVLNATSCQDARGGQWIFDICVSVPSIPVTNQSFRSRSAMSQQEAERRCHLNVIFYLHERDVVRESAIEFNSRRMAMQFPDSGEAEQVRKAFGTNKGDIFDKLSAHPKPTRDDNGKQPGDGAERQATDGASSNSGGSRLYWQWIDTSGRWGHLEANRM